MRRIWERSAPYALLAVLALPAIWPLGAPGLPRTNDALPHLYRALELAELVRAGEWLPRWGPHLAHGYGYPVFNYFPYLSHYSVVALHLLGLSLLAAYKVAAGLALLASAWWSFRLGREHFGAAAGMVAAVAYVYSPYLLYDTYVRGSLPESAALALLPLGMLYARRAARGDWWAAVWAALALAGAVLAHHGVMLQALGLVAAYAAWESWRCDHGHGVPATREAGAGRSSAHNGPASRYQKLLRGTRAGWLGRAALPFVLAGMLTAFFWLPAWAEARSAQVERGTNNESMRLENNFLRLGELLRLPRLPVDADLLNPPVVRSLPVTAGGVGIGLWLFGRAWTVVGRAKPFRRRPPPAGGQPKAAVGGEGAIVFWVGAAAGALLILPVARPLWEAVPLLKLTLFPWRLLGPVSLFIALGLAGVTRRWLLAAEGWPRQVGIWAVILILVTAGLPFASPPREAAPNDPTLADLANFEIPPDLIGTTTAGEYLPVWVQTLPDTGGDRLRLMLGETPDRHEAPGAEVTVVETGPKGTVFQLDAPAPTPFIYRVFHFPGWQAYVDGDPVAHEITAPHGLMLVMVPAGTHELAFRFEATGPRVAGGWLTGAGLLASVAVLGGASRRAKVQPAPRTTGDRAPQADNQSTVTNGWGFALALLLAVARPVLYDAGRTPLLRHGLETAGLAGVAPLNAEYAGEVRLLGAAVLPEAMAGDEMVLINLYWQAVQPLGVAYGFDVRLVDEAGHTWSEPEWARPRDWRFAPGTDFWPPDQYVWDPYLLRVLPGTPPGQYTLQVGVFTLHSLETIGTHAAGTLNVASPTRARACPDEAAGVAHAALDLRTVAGPAGAVPGDDVRLVLCWAVVAAPGGDLTGEAALVGADGQTWAAQTFGLGGPYPASRWAAGDVLRDQVTVRLPPGLPAGEYTWILTVSGGPRLKVGTLAVTAPERAYTSPPVEAVVGADLGPTTLFGVSVQRAGITPGADLPLRLVWRADDLMDESYHVFVHLTDADGNVVAQSDGVPAGWSRRTTGWLPGEFVTDDRVLHLRADLPPGQYNLWVGMYLAASGERLTTSAWPDGRVGLAPVEVE